MCKTCEDTAIRMPLRPLNLVRAQTEVELPKVWNRLKGKNFHPDLVQRVIASLAWTSRDAGLYRESDEGARRIKNIRAVIAALGEGFEIPFDRSRFETGEGARPAGRQNDLQAKALNAIQVLSDYFGDRVSSVVWNSFAHLAVRENPEQSRSILVERQSLPHHFAIVDTILHASGKVYPFMQKVQTVFAQHTGMILVHNCDCNCSLVSLSSAHSGPVPAFDFQAADSPAGREQREEATRSLLTHILAEAHLVLNAMLPFEFSITPEAGILFGPAQ